MALNSGWSYREQIGAKGSGLTVLDYLAASRTHSTPEEWAGRLLRGEVELEGIRARPDDILRAGQTLTWHRAPWEEPDVPTDVAIVYEDEAIVVVNKPSGLPTMPAGGFLEHTLFAFMRARYGTVLPQHRLGRCTSGLVVFARTTDAASVLSRAWREHRVKKTYRALVSGVVAADGFAIDAAIGPVPHPVLKAVEAASGAGKPSHSDVTVLERAAETTLVSIQIATGRPHQIRIHLAFAGHPLVGDPVYEVGGGIKAQPGLPGDGGYLLHAEQLMLAHPLTTKQMTLTSRPPLALLTRDERQHRDEGPS